ncbi:MAG: murein biosynthesis integral membrane protein MurJ [Pseudomonadota bacterium]
MSVATFLSRILGLVREQVTAAFFGAGANTDAFWVAYRIPNLLRDLFAESIFSSAFLPIFTEIRQKDEAAAKRLLWSTFTLLAILTGIISLLIMIFAPQVTMLFAPKFAHDPQKFELTVLLTRIMAPFLVLVSLAALFMGVLNSLKIFFVPSLAPAFFNVLMILSIVFLPPWLKKQGIHEIVSMAIGVISGGILQMLVQVPQLLRRSYGPTGPIKILSRETKRIIGRMSIGSIGVAASEINLLINTILATSTVVGAVSWLNYAFRIFQFPVGIFSVSLSGSNLVHFSEEWKAGNKEKAVEYLRISYLLSWMIMVPSTVFLYATANETIHLIYQRGLFSQNDTLMCTQAFCLYLLGLPFYGLYKIFAPVFYVFDKPQIPVFISVSTIVINVIFCLLLVPHFGFQVLAFGATLTMLLNSLAQAFFLRRFLELKASFFLDGRVLKILLMGVISFILSKWLIAQYFNFDHHLVNKIMVYLLVGAVTALVYVGGLMLLGEGQILKKIIKRK